ncbi:MAG: zf-HC2 domain-containing protein [Anaerotignum sp.]|nr:zf-HC2 domain-containing protein [Anaerotignum sp.]
MKCERCRDLLWAYLEQETTAEEAKEIEIHLAECAACRKEMEDCKTMLESLHTLSDEALPKGYHAELMEALREENGAKVLPIPAGKTTAKWKQMSLVAAAMLLIVAVGGIKGVMHLRQGDYGVSVQMTESADETMEMTETITAKSLPDAGETEGKAAMEQIAVPEQSKKKTASSLSNESDEGMLDDAAAEEESVAFRSAAADEAAGDRVVLRVETIDAAKIDIRECIEVLGGAVEESGDGNSICAVIPAEQAEVFYERLNKIGDAQRLTDFAQESDVYCIEIILEQK